MEDPVAVNDTATTNADANVLEAKISETLRKAEEIPLCEEQMSSVDQKPTEATDEETCSDNAEEKSLSMATSDDNTCTTLRLDTVMNIKSKSEDFAGEEKKDDSDEPAVIEEPIEEMPVACVTVTSQAEPKVENAQAVNKVPEAEPEADEPEDDTDMTDESDESPHQEEILVKESTIEEATGVVVPMMFDYDNEEEEEDEEEEENAAAPATKETNSPAKAYSMDSDRPTEEAQVTTKPTISMDSDAPAGEADITTKSTSMSEVQVTEETIVSKKSSGDSSLVQTESPPAEKTNTGGLFSCGAPLCGRMSDVMDSEPVAAEEIKTNTEEAPAKSEEGETTEAPAELMTEETSAISTSEKDDTPEEEAAEKEDEEKNESKPDISTREDASSACSVEQETDADIQEQTVEVESNDVAPNEGDKAEATVDAVAPEDTKDDDILLEGPRMIDIANMKIDGASFDVQESYSCSTFFNYGGISPPAKASAPAKSEEVDIRMTLSQDLIMEAREEGEKELEERSSEDCLAKIAEEEEEETTAEQPSPVEPSVESKSEPKDKITDDATTAETTGQTTQTALEGALEEEPKESDIPSEQPKEEQAGLDKPVAAEVDTTAEQLATDVEEQPEKKENKEEDDADAVSFDSSSSPDAAPAPESCEEDAPAQTDGKGAEVGTAESADATPEEPVTREDEVTSPSTELVVDEEAMFKAQQEAYACGNGTCAIL